MVYNHQTRHVTTGSGKQLPQPCFFPFPQKIVTGYVRAPDLVAQQDGPPKSPLEVGVKFVAAARDTIEEHVIVHQAQSFAVH